MSLINQMLQDLEQRSVGGLAGTGMHNQVRAAPERKRIHPAWWLVLVLSLLLIAGGLWMWLRPVPVASQSPELALKIAPRLGTLPSPVAQSPLPMEVAPAVAPVVAPTPAPVLPLTPPIQNNDAVTPPQHPAPLKDAPRIADLRPVPQAGDIEQKESVRKKPDAEQAKPFELAKQVKELTPQQQAENEYRKAGVSLQMGRQADAMTSLEQALKLDPKHAAARQTLVGLLLQAKRNDDAVRIAQDGLALDPSQTGLSMILARIQVEQGDIHTALATLERGLPTAGTRADYHAFMAALLQRDKRNKEAIDQYSIALGTTPQSGVWWMGLGISLQAENRLVDAKEAFSRAKATNSLTPELQAFVDQKLAQLNK